MKRPPFPAVLDSTIIAAFRSCPQKAFREYVQHWKSKNPSVHLHAGGAFAAGLEAGRRAFFLEGASEEVSIALGVGELLRFYGNFECPEDSPKSATRMAGALEYYFSKWPLSTEYAPPASLPSGKKAIEFSFAEPIDETHPETGDPLLYCGRMDQICEFAGGHFGEDDKTASQLGASWPKQWNLRSQFTGYVWGAGRMGFKLSGFLVRGVSILKTKYDSMETITYRPEWMVERWYTQLLSDVRRMKECWEKGYWDYSLDHACVEFGGCPFSQICQTPPESQLPWLEANFERRVWNPVSRAEEAPRDNVF